MLVVLLTPLADVVVPLIGVLVPLSKYKTTDVIDPAVECALAVADRFAYVPSPSTVPEEVALIAVADVNVGRE